MSTVAIDFASKPDQLAVAMYDGTRFQMLEGIAWLAGPKKVRTRRAGRKVSRKQWRRQNARAMRRRLRMDSYFKRQAAKVARELDDRLFKMLSSGPAYASAFNDMMDAMNEAAALGTGIANVRLSGA